MNEYLRRKTVGLLSVLRRSLLSSLASNLPLPLSGVSDPMLDVLLEVVVMHKEAGGEWAEQIVRSLLESILQAMLDFLRVWDLSAVHGQQLHQVVLDVLFIEAILHHYLSPAATDMCRQLKEEVVGPRAGPLPRSSSALVGEAVAKTGAMFACFQPASQ